MGLKLKTLMHNNKEINTLIALVKTENKPKTTTSAQWQ